MSSLPPGAPDAAFNSALATAVATAGLSDSEQESDLVTGGSVRKRAFRDSRAGSRLASVALVKDDEVLRWVYEPPPVSVGRRRGRRSLNLVNEANLLPGFQFREIPPNEIRSKLNQLDLKLTPARGLRAWSKGKLQPYVRPKKLEGRVLLLIHGTFSKGDMYFEEFASTPEGQAFLAKAETTYDVILTFDHPTLTVAPWINAIDLHAALGTPEGEIDVICHSRGGLVASWWLYFQKPRIRNLVFVASPLEGTSLAAPARIKSALDLLGNLARGVGSVAGTAATVVPMLAIAGGLMKILGGVIGFAARSSLVDAGVSLVPGLVAQSRDASNEELERLYRSDWAAKLSIHAVQSNYEPPENIEPWWKFWSHFRQLPGRVADFGADRLFAGPNDLVVDVASMTQLGSTAIPLKNRLDLSDARSVHHCGYFRQPRTIGFLTSVLKL
jgi:pimeloyl-ACP methyl ester carboxylesterase